MANYEGTARSNYFPFIPSKLLCIEELWPGDIQIVHKPPLVSIISRVSGTPTIEIDNDNEELEDVLHELGVPNAENINDISLLDIIHHVLPPDTSLVWIEVGHEKARYLVGQAIRINHLGEIVQTIDLNSIYAEGEPRAEY